MEYIPKNILVTGGCGFIGSILVVELLRQYKDVHVITLDKITYCSKANPLEMCSSVEEKEELSKRHTFIRGDITDFDCVCNTIRVHKVDTIMHLAAETHVDRSFQQSIEFTKTNVLGTHTLLQAALENRDLVKRFVHVSTDEVYGENLDEEPFHEEKSVLNPTNPYAASKVGAEALVKSYITSFGLPCIITRGNNVYGPGQHAEKVIPNFISRLLAEKRLKVHGNGQAQRNFLYVTDTVNALITIMKYGTLGSIYNIAGIDEMTILDLAKRIIHKMIPEETDDCQKYIQFVADRQFNDQRYHINSNKLRGLGWQPLVSFDEGLARTIEFYQNHWQEEEANIPSCVDE
jgi:dTDP-glucose 4,6-dehydratase